MERTLQLVRVHPYDAAVQIVPGVELRFLDAGHIMGSASVWLRLMEGGLMRHVVFSGDVGQYDSPILRDPQSDQEKVVDLALMESTYGDRRHRDRADTLRELGDSLAAAKRNGGNVLIPAFAVARAARPRSCRNSGSAVRRRSRWRSTASRTARSSSRAAACARAGASCTI